VRRLLAHAPLAVTDARWSEPRTKANALLQAHFSRQPLSGDLAADQRTVVLQATRLLQARAVAAQMVAVAVALPDRQISDPVVLCM
jgi:hypothetical protein